MPSPRKPAQARPRPARPSRPSAASPAASNSSAPSATPESTAAFESEARRSLESLRLAVGRVLDTIPGSQHRAVDIRRALDLDAALAWQIHTIATTADPLTAGRVVPKAGAMERFLAQAKAQRVPVSLVSAARSAYEQFERVVDHHAGGRDTFEAMVSALRPDDGPALKRLRKAAHRAAAAVWGLSVRVRLNCVVFHERPTGEHDCLVLRARVGVKCFREGATIGFHASGLTWGGAHPATAADPRVAIDSCELLPDYCTEPIPRILTHALPEGPRWDHLQLQALGRSREISLFWRNLSLNFPGGSATPPHGCTAECLEPTELTVMDLLVPKGWTDPSTAQCWMTPLTGVYGPHAIGSRLPFEGEVAYLGSRIPDLYTSHSPVYVEALTRLLEQRGWSNTYDIYRCEVAYPILHTAVHVRVDGAAEPDK